MTALRGVYVIEILSFWMRYSVGEYAELPNKVHM